MRIFGLTTGRSGSTTFTEACKHLSNYTAGHETRKHILDGRFDYPDNHIEIDLRLAWSLGPLGLRFPDAFYVHLTRDPERVAASWASLSLDVSPGRLRFGEARRRLAGHFWCRMPDTFNHGILAFPRRMSPEEARRSARLMVDVMNDNVTDFLRDRPHIVIPIESAAKVFPTFCEFIGAEGDLDAAVAEFNISHNAEIGPKGRRKFV